MIKALINGKHTELPDNVLDKFNNLKKDKKPTTEERIAALETAVADLALAQMEGNTNG